MSVQLLVADLCPDALGLQAHCVADALVVLVTAAVPQETLVAVHLHGLTLPGVSQATGRQS